MGTWGEGNFDNDTASEHIWMLAEGLIKEINEAMSNPKDLEPDELGGVIVPCNVEMLSLLAGKRWGSSVPKPSVVEHWKATYMEVWESHIDELCRPEYPDHKARRRAVLIKTFDQLLDYAIQ